jgi:GNAT superfamily N-acetyltransferase
MIDIFIRSARAADLPRLFELYAQLAIESDEPPRTPTANDARAFHDVLADPRQTVLVAEVDGRLAGAATLIIIPNATHGGAPYAIAENVVVDAPMRGHGLGQALIRRAADDARAAGCYKLSLTSRLVREDAHRFYERLGFRTTQRAFRLDL